MGPIAQPVEQRTFNPWVDSSSLSGPTDLCHFHFSSDYLAVLFDVTFEGASSETKGPSS